MSDFPAAHSMDTTWWGLDRHGRLARFDTGEAGAAPADGAGEAEEVDLVRALGESFPFSCDDLFPVADGRLLMHPNLWEDEPLSEPIEVDASSDAYLPAFLLWLVDEDALDTISSAPDGEKLVRLQVPGKIVIWLASEWREGQEEQRGLLPQVLAWKDQGLVQRGWLYELGSVEIERLGLFHYNLRTFDNWICGPYTRGEAPARPLRLQDLPRKVQKSLGVCELPLADFERDVLLQPYEHGEAVSWDDQWVSTTGELKEGELEEEEELPVPAIQPERAASREVALVAAYLRGDKGAADVLGDWLEEQGRERIPAVDTVSGRMDEVLLRWFRPEQRAALEVAFLEHALQTQPVAPELQQTLSALVRAIRASDAEALQAAAQGAFVAWQPEQESAQTNRLAWAGWALGNEHALVCARTLRVLHPELLQHQVERVLAEISG
jgi:hypothetical protein